MGKLGGQRRLKMSNVGTTVNLTQHPARLFHFSVVEQQVLLGEAQILPDKSDVFVTQTHARSRDHFELEKGKIAHEVNSFYRRVQLEGREIKFLVLVDHDAGKIGCLLGL